MKIQPLISIPITLVISILGYFVGFKQATKISERYKQEVVEETLRTNPPPECHSTNCPEYTFFDADGDGLNESIVTEYTTMTQGAGRVWVIDKGKVVFKSEEKAQISVEPISKTGDNNGFVIGYNTTYQLSQDFLKSFKSDYYEYKDGKFVLIKTVDNR